MAVAVSGFVVDDLSLSVDPARDDGDLALVAQVFADCVGVVALVGDQIARSCCAVEQQAGSLHVRYMARGQVEGVGPPERVGEGVDLGCLTAAREADRLIFRPPFPPWAERCAFT